MRRLERLFKAKKTVASREAWRSALKLSRKQSHAKSASYWKRKLSGIGNNPRRMWQAVNSLHGEKKTTAAPVFTAKDYHDYIDRKITDIRVTTSHVGEPSFVVSDIAMSLCVFRSITVDDVVATIR